MKKKIFVILFFALMMLPTIVAAQSESDTTQWTDLYDFSLPVAGNGFSVGYDFSYNAPFDRATGEAGYAVSTATLKEIRVVAEGPLISTNFLVDIEVALSDLELVAGVPLEWYFLNMLNGQEEIIELNVDYLDAHNEWASVTVLSKYDLPAHQDSDMIGAKLIFVWELGWQKSFGIGLFEIAIIGIMVFSVFIIMRMRD